MFDWLKDPYLVLIFIFVVVLIWVNPMGILNRRK